MGDSSGNASQENLPNNKKLLRQCQSRKSPKEVYDTS